MINNTSYDILLLDTSSHQKKNIISPSQLKN